MASEKIKTYIIGCMVAGIITASGSIFTDCRKCLRELYENPDVPIFVPFVENLKLEPDMVYSRTASAIEVPSVLVQWNLMM